MPLAITQLIGGSRDATGSSLIRDMPRVRDALHLSYRRLPPDQQRAFRRLSLYPGHDMTAEMVSVLADTPVEAAGPLIDSLLRRHLMEEGESGRFRLHRVVRRVAYDLARNVDHERETRATVRRLLRHCLRAADAADRAMFPHRWKALTVPENDRWDLPALSTARDWFDAEWRNVLALARYAFEHEWKTECAQLTHVLAEYLDFRHLLTEAAEGHALAIRACRDIGDDLGVARASLDLCLARFQTACYRDAAYYAGEALSFYEARGHRREMAICYERLGLACWGKDERRLALAFWDDAEDLYRELADRKGIADILRHKARARWNIGQYGEMKRLYDEALVIYKEIGDRLGEMKTLNDKGYVAQTMARHRDADTLYRRAGEIYKEITGQENHAILDHNQGDLNNYMRRYEIALDCYERALTAYRMAGHRRNQADVLNGMGEAYLGLGRSSAALGHFEQAKGLAAEIDCTSEEARALMGIASSQREMDNHELALDTYKNALSLARAIDDRRQQAMILDEQALTLSRCGRSDLARAVWRHAFGLCEDIGLQELARDIKLKLQTLGGVSMDFD